MNLFTKIGDGIKKAANTVVSGTKTAVTAVKNEVTKDANIVKQTYLDAVHKTSAFFVNAEHTVARTSLKTVGQVTAWTNRAG